MGSSHFVSDALTRGRQQPLLECRTNIFIPFSCALMPAFLLVPRSPGSFSQRTFVPSATRSLCVPGLLERSCTVENTPGPTLLHPPRRGDLKGRTEAAPPAPGPRSRSARAGRRDYTSRPPLQALAQRGMPGAVVAAAW